MIDHTQYIVSSGRVSSLATFADDGIDWITINGTHIPLKGGKIVGGPPALRMARILKSAKVKVGDKHYGGKGNEKSAHTHAKEIVAEMQKRGLSSAQQHSKMEELERHISDYHSSKKSANGNLTT